MVLKKNQPGYVETKDKNGKTYWKKEESATKAQSLDSSISSATGAQSDFYDEEEDYDDLDDWGYADNYEDEEDLDDLLKEFDDYDEIDIDDDDNFGSFGDDYDDGDLDRDNFEYDYR